MRDDVNCTFEQALGCFPRPAFAVYLKGLESVATLPKDISARIAQEKGILPSGSPRIFLKADKDMTFIPSTKADRLRDAPNTVFARCLYLSRVTGFTDCGIPTKLMQTDR